MWKGVEKLDCESAQNLALTINVSGYNRILVAKTVPGEKRIVLLLVVV